MPPSKAPASRRSSPPKKNNSPSRGKRKTFRESIASDAETGEDCVGSCIHAQQPTVVIASEYTMAALGINTTVLGVCLNKSCQIPEGKKFAGGEIKGSWTVGRVRAEAASRGTC